MANKKAENEELRKVNEELRKQVESLMIRNRSLTEQHIKDAHMLHDLRENQAKALEEVGSIYELYMTELVELYGEAVEDEDKTIIGKRIEFSPSMKLDKNKRFDLKAIYDPLKPRMVLGVIYEEGEK